MTWTDIGLRVLPDGATQLSVPIDNGVCLIRLGDTGLRQNVFSTTYVADAVLFDDRSALLLEYFDPRMYVVRRVDPDGSPVWALEFTPDADGVNEVDQDSQLLVDGTGRVLLSNRTSLVRVDDGSGQCLYRWRGASAVAYQDGRIGYSRPRADHVWGLDYVTIDLAGNSEKVLPSVDHRDWLLVRLIGVDADDRVYGKGLQRMSAAGELEWHATVGGIVISDDFHVLVQTEFIERGTERLIARIGELTMDLTRHRGSLIDCDIDGSYILRQRPTTRTPDMVHVFDAGGRLVRSEPSPDDVALAHFVMQSPTQSSVTREGEVLVVVKGPAGVYVVGLRPAGTEK
jgi:hypothetical protein